MASKRRYYLASNSFAAGLLSEAAIDTVGSELAQMGLAQADNVVILRDGGLATRPPMQRATGPGIPRPSHSAIVIEPPEAPINAQATIDRRGGNDWALVFDNDGVIDYRREITVKAVSATDPLFRVAFAAGTKPRSLTFHGVRMVQGSRITAVGADDRQTFEVWIRKRGGAMPERLHDEDAGPMDLGVFSPGVVARDITISLDFDSPEPLDLVYAELRVPHSETPVGTAFIFDGLSAFTSHAGRGFGTGGQALGEEVLKHAVRILPWSVQDTALAFVLGIDFAGVYHLPEGQAPQLLIDAYAAWHFTARQLRELTWCAFGTSLLLLHHDFPHPLLVQLPTIARRNLSITYLDLSNVPDLPADFEDDAAVTADTRGGRITLTSPPDIAGAVEGLILTAGNLELLVEWDASDANTYDIVWDTAANYDADPSAWLNLRRQTVLSAALPGSKAIGHADTEYRITGLTGNVDYVVAVRGIEGVSIGPLSPVLRLAPFLGGPRALQNVSGALSDTQDGVITLTWTADERIAGGGGYIVEWQDAQPPDEWTRMITSMTSFTLNGVPGTEYHFRVRMFDRGRRLGPWSRTLPFIAANLRPAVPQNLAAAIGTVDRRIRWTWDAAARAVQYQVRHRQKTTPPSAWTTEDAQNNRWFDFDGTVGNLGEVYELQVRSVRAFSGVNPWTASVELQLKNLPPDKVEDLAANEGSGSGEVDLTWTAPVLPSPTGYEVQQRVGAGAWMDIAHSGTSASVTFTGALGTTYDFRVRATRTGADSGDWSDIISRQAGAATPGIPTGLTLAQGVDRGQIAVSWTPGGNADGYKLRYRTTGTLAWTEVHNLSTTSYTFSGDEGTSYDFAVRSTRNMANDSAWTATMSLRASVRPLGTAGPTGLRVTARTQDAFSLNRGVTVGWNRLGAAASYQLRYRRTRDPIGAWTSSGRIGQSAAPAQVMSHLSADFSPSRTSLLQEYEVQVRATESGGTTTQWSPSLTFINTGDISLTAPSNLSSSGITSTGFTVNWTRGSLRGTGDVREPTSQIISWRPSGRAGWSQTDSLANSATSHTFVAEASTTYEVRVRTYEPLDTQSSPWSATYSVTTPA